MQQYPNRKDISNHWAQYLDQSHWFKYLKYLIVQLFLLTFSILYFSKACVAQSTASCCISSDMSAFLITAFRSAIPLKFCQNFCRIWNVRMNQTCCVIGPLWMLKMMNKSILVLKDQSWIFFFQKPRSFYCTDLGNSKSTIESSTLTTDNVKFKILLTGAVLPFC